MLVFVIVVFRTVRHVRHVYNVITVKFVYAWQWYLKTRCWKGAFLNTIWYRKSWPCPLTLTSKSNEFIFGAQWHHSCKFGEIVNYKQFVRYRVRKCFRLWSCTDSRTIERTLTAWKQNAFADLSRIRIIYMYPDLHRKLTECCAYYFVVCTLHSSLF